MLSLIIVYIFFIAAFIFIHLSRTCSVAASKQNTRHFQSKQSYWQCVHFLIACFLAVGHWTCALHSRYRWSVCIENFHIFSLRSIWRRLYDCSSQMSLNLFSYLSLAIMKICHCYSTDFPIFRQYFPNKMHFASAFLSVVCCRCYVQTIIFHLNRLSTQHSLHSHSGHWNTNIYRACRCL